MILSASPLLPSSSAFARFSFLAKFLIAFLAFLCSFQGAFLKSLNFFRLSFSSNPFRFSDPFRLLQLSDPSKRYRVISEELTNLSILLCRSLSGSDALRFRSVSICLLYSSFPAFFLTRFRSASVPLSLPFRFPSSCSTSESDLISQIMSP